MYIFADKGPFDAPNNIVTIVNMKHNESLKTGDPTGNYEAWIPVNYVFTDRTTGSKAQQWTLKATGVMNRYKIRNNLSGLLLIDSEVIQDLKRRKVVAWTGNTPVARYLDEEVWDLIPHADGFAIRNFRYAEYLYAESDDLAFDDKNRSVFTWKDLDNLGTEGYWKIETVKQ